MQTATLICQPVPAPVWLDWPGNVPALGPDDVLLLRLYVPDWTNRLGALLRTLSPTEQQRAERFRQATDRQRFIMGRGVMRFLLGYVTGQQPADVQLGTSANGKPEPVGADGWHVNVSHAGDWVLVALARQPVGVDVEYIGADFAYHELIPSCFGPPEQRALTETRQHSTDAERQLFYTFWTRKEAIIKATGLGMTEQLTAFSVLDGPQTVPASAMGAAGTWVIQSFALSGTYRVAVAAESRSQRINNTLPYTVLSL